MKKVFKLLSLSCNEWLIFIVSWFTYLKWDLLISLFHYKNWKQQLGELPQVDESVDFSIIRKLIVINEMAGRNHLRKMNCLRRCLCQKEMLKKRNIQSILHIGVKLTKGKLEAHSWLTCNQVIINDAKEEIAKYKELVKSDKLETTMFFN